MAAEHDPLLRAFLDGYYESYYDWGDDPSFFAAQQLLGDVRKASWGVCRPDVRETLVEGDLLVFFCGSQDEHWRYYFVGFGTVGKLVERADLWTNPRYASYRKFYNVLARPDGGDLIQCETFHDFHGDWQRRAEAPYVIFEAANSAFNLGSPHLVAIWDKATKPPETWAGDARSREIERLLFVERGIDDRRLRTSAFGYGHTKLNLLAAGRTARPGRSLSGLARALKHLV
jgi:hypothetical protein